MLEKQLKVIESSYCEKGVPSNVVINPIQAYKSSDDIIDDSSIDINSSKEVFNLSFRDGSFDSFKQSPLSSAISSDTSHSSYSLLLFGGSIALAWIYVIIPTNNYWIFSMVKQEWWAIIGMINYMELQDACLPNVSDVTYILSYTLGLSLSPILFVIVYVMDTDYSNIPALAISLPVVIITILYGLDSIVNRRREDVMNETPMTNTEAIINILFDTSRASSTPKLSLAQVYELPKNKNSSSTSFGLCILPRFVYRSLGLSKPELCGDSVVQWILATTFGSLYILNFQFLIYFTFYFRGHSSSGIGKKTVLFMIYLFVNTIFRVVLKRIGLAIDRRKRGSLSLFFIGECIGLFFYFTFYRILFESLNWTDFAVFQSCHLLSEWVLYPLRSSLWLLGIIRAIEHRFPIIIGIFLPPGTDQQDWLHFIALDFGLRVLVIITTSVEMLVMLATIDFFPWVSSGLNQGLASLELSSTILIVALVTELLNAYMMDLTYYQPQGISVMIKVKHCFRDVKFSFLVFMIAAILMINPMYAFIENAPL